MSGPEDWESTQVEPTLTFFNECFHRLGIEWCVAGAVAANAYRAPRATTDLDLVVQIRATSVTTVITALEDAGWQVLRRSPDTDYPDIMRLRHPTFFPTDLLLAKIPYQQEALQRARASASAAGSFRVLSPEDVVIHKLIAYRHRDRADLHEILRSRTPLDRQYVERWCEFWDIMDRWQESLSEAR